MRREINGKALTLTTGDITRQEVDAVVNAANSSLMGGSGVDGAIHSAGGPTILEECKKIVAEKGRLRTGKAVSTTGGEMAARRVIHTVGPIWRGGYLKEEELLGSAYRESLELAEREGLAVVAFPSISTGAYGYPVEPAAKVAVREAARFLEGAARVREVRFVLFSYRIYSVFAKTVEELLHS